MTEKLSGLIVGEHGRMRDCLQALLVSIPQISEVFQADNFETSQNILDEQNISFVLIDSIFSHEKLETLIQGIKHQPASVKSLVIVENSTEERQLKDAGADEVLVRGASAEEFIEALSRVIPIESLRERLALCAEQGVESAEANPIHQSN